MMEWLKDTTEIDNWLFALWAVAMLVSWFKPKHWRLEYRFFENGRFCWRRIK